MKCPNCGNDLIPGALFCASCGNKIPEELLNAAASVGETPVESKPETVPVADENENTENVVTATAGEAGNTAQTAQTAASQIPMGALVVPEMETDKKKKTRTRLIGVAAVAVVVAAVGFGGFKVWNAMNPQLDKQMIYAKDGRLYFTPNVSKEKDPVEIYNAHDNETSYEIKYTKNQKYAFFLTDSEDEQRLYRVNTQKLTSNESKNDKYIEEIDSGVTDFSVLGSDRILYYRDSNSGRELNFYDGKDTKEIDSKVKAQCHSGNVVYYLRDEGDDYNYELYYYNLKTGKHGDIDECIEVADYNENEILYSVSDGDTCDIYKAKPGSEGTKIVSDVASDWTGNLDAGVISYKREIKESKSYYDFVNDPYAAEDANATEPQMDDYLTEVDPEDVLDSYAYNNYLDDRSYFYSNDTSMDSITINDTSYYSCYSNSNVYYNYDNDDFYLCDEDAYSEAYDDYYAAGNRDDLRDALKDLTFDSTSYDLYLYTSKGGEKKIAESILPIDSDPVNQIFLYRKAQDLGDEKVCSIDDLYDASDVENYIYNSDNDSSVYVNINGKEQDMKMTSVSMNCSEDGKTVMVVDQSDEDSNELIAYKKKGDSLEKIGTVEKDYTTGSWYGNDYYYFDDNNDFYIYSNGKSKKIAKDVKVAELEDDGNFMVFDVDSSYESSDLKVLKGDEQIGKIRDVGYYGATYVDKNCIVYITNDGDLNVYDGEDSRKIDRDVYRYWMGDDRDKATFSGWY
ncbi:MAG: zinc ribbon domain-containing protein [Lachnobacterium sp.]|nr:zinc ribbon domain-containing protein [Lachnobacterium sp.]